MTTGSPEKNSAKLRIAYVGPFRFPNDAAPSRRILGIASTLVQLGHEVVVGAGQYETEPIETPYAKSLPFELYSLREMPKRDAPKLRKLFRCFTWGENTLRWLQDLKPRPDVVFACGWYSPYSRRILPWCRSEGIPVVVDVVEWFQPSHLPGGWFGPFHWDVEIALRHYYVQAGNIIAISRLLENYYQSRNCRTLRMPPTLDVAGVEPRLTAFEGPLTLAYAGFPGKKDLIGNVVEAVLRIDPEGDKVRLIMAGPKECDVLRLPALRSRCAQALPPAIKALGPTSHADVLNLVRNADFVPLLRPPLRYAQAGFPTKVPEAMSLGTPVMCNLTSDLGDYVRDGENGIVCRDYSPEGFAEGLNRALALSVERRSRMRQAARLQAEVAFDYRVFAEPLAEFLNTLKTQER